MVSGVFGEVPERSKGTDCKSVGSAFAGSNPALTTKSHAGIAQLARATAFQAVGCGFESRFPLHIRKKIAGIAQLVEQLICNQQVAGSSPAASSKIMVVDKFVDDHFFCLVVII